MARAHRFRCALVLLAIALAAGAAAGETPAETAQPAQAQAPALSDDKNLFEKGLESLLREGDPGTRDANEFKRKLQQKLGPHFTPALVKRLIDHADILLGLMAMRVELQAREKELDARIKKLEPDLFDTKKIPGTKKRITCPTCKGNKHNCTTCWGKGYIVKRTHAKTLQIRNKKVSDQIFACEHEQTTIKRVQEQMQALIPKLAKFLAHTDLSLQGQEGMVELMGMAARGQNISFMEILRRRGVDANCRDGDEQTPLHIAALEDRIEAAKWLLGKGAEIDAQDDQEQTPLYLAAKKGHRRMVKLLLDRGADKEIKDRRNRTPARIAQRYKHVNALEHLDPEEAKKIKERQKK